MPNVSKKKGRPVSKGRVASSCAAVLLALLLSTAAAAQATPNPERRNVDIEPRLRGETTAQLPPAPDFEVKPRKSLLVAEKAALKSRFLPFRPEILIQDFFGGS